MGAAKNRKAEIAQLKAAGPKEKVSNNWREQYVMICKQSKVTCDQEMEKYASKLNEVTTAEAMAFMEECDRIKLTPAMQIGCQLVRAGVPIAAVKDAAWEGFNGLMEACAVEQNIQINLGLPQSKIDPSQFMKTGPNAMAEAEAAGWFK